MLDICLAFHFNGVLHFVDGEVESFKLIPVTNVANVIRRTEFFKANCSLVITDFLFRHGYDCWLFFVLSCVIS